LVVKIVKNPESIDESEEKKGEENEQRGYRDTTGIPEKIHDGGEEKG
jgi:hypothetical protein